ncbi:hypothetical protein AX774_g2263 [Zancudomyces culisetae]|uniref:Uncharacterized protein n=1 Tax=Zancudomyces culisetae TaxID=1213189 RepID=A0A1R1PTE2_ZANCU|nr:hypothetical protein AX774_g2263 [Zancudomyces culisetae]|eukprot:OMH84217.1 hypothetical protein AX774_g2263 [Zancudomyces culisetae]
MYVVIDRNTSTVVYKGTIFMNEGEYLDVDIGSLFLENSESEKDLIDIKISHSLYFRPLVASRLGMKVLFKKLRTTLQTMAVEALIYVYDAKIKLPLGVSVSVEKNIKFTASKAILYSILVAARRSCELDIIELLKRVLEFNIKVTLSIQELRAFNNVYNMYTFGRSIAFIKKYGYETNMELLIYMACLCYSICWDREEQVKLLEDNYPDAICQQMLFDAAIFHEKTSLVKEYFFKVELNSENIRKITEMAYDRGYIDMIKFLLNHSDKLKGDLDENAIMIAIEHSDYELTKEIINKYPNIVSASCLAEAVESGDIRIAKLLINSGINLKSPEFNGITIANRNNDINMLQLLLENGASDGSLD